MPLGKNLLAYGPIFPYENDSENYWVIFEMAPKDTALRSVEKLESAVASLSITFLGLFSLGALSLVHIAESAISELKWQIEQETPQKKITTPSDKKKT